MRARPELSDACLQFLEFVPPFSIRLLVSFPEQEIIPGRKMFFPICVELRAERLYIRMILMRHRLTFTPVRFRFAQRFIAQQRQNFAAAEDVTDVTRNASRDAFQCDFRHNCFSSISISRCEDFS